MDSLSVIPPDPASRLAVDAQSLEGLKRSARANPDSAVRQAARQFEALFMNMLMKSMRESLPKEDPLASSATQMATGMLDEQWAQSLSGRGLGLADLMMKQLQSSRSGAKGIGHHATASGMLKKLDAANRAALQEGAAGLPAKSAGAEVAVRTGEASAQRPVSTAPQEFVRRMRSHAAEAEKTSGIPAHFILGQAALESGWGRREIRATDGTTSHNLFGIKAGRGWTGPTVDAVTVEYVNGSARRSVEKFRAYASYGEAFSDYAALMARSSRYASVARATDDASVFAGRMQAAGYATDPAYARKLTAVINQTLALQSVA